MSPAAADLTCDAYAISDNVRIGGSRFLGPVQLRSRRGRVSLRGRRVSVMWLFTRWFLELFSSVLGSDSRVTKTGWVDVDPQPWEDAKSGYDSRSVSPREQATVSWVAGHSQLVGSYESCVSGSMLRRTIVRSAGMAREIRPVGLEDRYIVVQVKIPIGWKGRLRLLQLEVPAVREQRLRQVLSGVEPAEGLL